MPGNPRSLDVTDRYRTGLVGLRARTLQAVAATWGVVSLDDLDQTGDRWARMAGAIVATAREQAALASTAYLAAYLTSETGRAVTAQQPDTARYAQQLDTGKSPGEGMASALVAVRVALAHQRPAAHALQAGLVRARGMASANVSQAAREQLSDAIQADDRVAGWRRATSGSPCGACLAAATGAVRADSDVPEAHTHCQCVAEPVVRGVRERAHRPTGQELFDAMTPADQDALFAGRGGAEKAELIRTGQVQLRDLLDRSGMAATADQITERPLSALRG